MQPLLDIRGLHVNYGAIQALHELRPPTVVFRAVIEIDDQGADVAKARLHLFPPLDQAVN